MDTKNLEFTDLRNQLQHMRDARFDVVLNSRDLTADRYGNIIIPEIDNVITEHGVGIPETLLTVNDHAVQQIATKWKIPVRYLRSLREKQPEQFAYLYRDTINDHMKCEPIEVLVRSFVEPGSHEGTMRAMLSPQYGFADHYDVLVAVFDGLRTAREIHGIDFQTGNASLSDTHMRARINMPTLRTAATELLKNYRSPYSGKTGADNPNLFLGIEIRNSEVGAGSFNIVPVIVVEVCNNGLTLTKELFRKVHLGSRMDSGQVSHKTTRATMDLISSQTTDYVMSIANEEYLQQQVDIMMGLTVEVKPTLVQDHLTKVYSDTHANAIFDAFITGGDITAFGVAQAITAASQSNAFNADEARNADDDALTIAAHCAKAAV